MKRIALVTTLAAFAAPASALAESQELVSLNTDPVVTSENVNGLSAVFGAAFEGMRNRAYFKQQKSDDGSSGSGLDEGRLKPVLDHTRAYQRRNQADFGDPGRDRPELNRDAWQRKYQADFGDPGRDRPELNRGAWQRKPVEDPGESRGDGLDYSERYGKQTATLTARLMKALQQRVLIQKKSDDGSSGSGLDGGRVKPTIEHNLTWKIRKVNDPDVRIEKD